MQPFDHSKKLAKFSYADKSLIEKAIKTSLEAREAWELRPLRERIEIMLKAADLCATKYRMDLNAATMLGQGKTIIQAEIDSACEITDFLRFNSWFALVSEFEYFGPIVCGYFFYRKSKNVSQFQRILILIK